MDSQQRTARLAGFLYLVVVVCGIFSLAYIPSKLIVWNDAALTFKNIQESETLFRLDIASGIACYIAFLLLPFVLYQLLSTVNKTYAVAMVVFATASVPIALLNLVNKVNVLTLIDRSKHARAGVEDIAGQVLSYLQSYNNGISIVAVFWGLWLWPFGYLVFKSGFLPKLLGILLMAGCVGYMINTFGNLLFDNYSSWGIRRFASLPASLGEIGICLWLLIAGVRRKATV